LTGLSAFAELRFGGCYGRRTWLRLLAGEFLLAVAGAEPPGGQDRGEQGDAGGDQEREPVPGDQRAGGVVLAGCLTGEGSRDAAQHRFLRTSDVAEGVPVKLARRAAWLRATARTGSAVDALVIAVAEPTARSCPATSLTCRP
jgi:hypothetical protein